MALIRSGRWWCAHGRSSNRAIGAAAAGEYLDEVPSANVTLVDRDGPPGAIVEDRPDTRGR